MLEYCDEVFRWIKPLGLGYIYIVQVTHSTTLVLLTAYILLTICTCNKSCKRANVVFHLCFHLFHCK